MVTPFPVRSLRASGSTHCAQTFHFTYPTFAPQSRCRMSRLALVSSSARHTSRRSPWKWKGWCSRPWSLPDVSMGRCLKDRMPARLRHAHHRISGRLPNSCASVDRAACVHRRSVGDLLGPGGHSRLAASLSRSRGYRQLPSSAERHPTSTGHHFTLYWPFAASPQVGTR